MWFLYFQVSFLLNLNIRSLLTCSIAFFSLSLISSPLHCSSSSSSSSWAMRASSRLLSSAIWALVHIESRWDVSSGARTGKNWNCRCLFYFLAAELLISSCSSSLSCWACLFTRSEAASSYGWIDRKIALLSLHIIELSFVVYIWNT